MLLMNARFRRSHMLLATFWLLHADHGFERRQAVAILQSSGCVLESELKAQPVLKFVVPTPERRCEAVRRILGEPGGTVRPTEFGGRIHHVRKAPVRLIH